MGKENDLRERTKKFALRVIKLVNALPYNVSGKNIGNQLFRSGTSVAANYRAVCRSKSKADFISKLGTVIEEVDESAFWLEIIIESGIFKINLVEPLLDEANQLTAIMVSSKKSASNNHS